MAETGNEKLEIDTNGSLGSFIFHLAFAGGLGAYIGWHFIPWLIALATFLFNALLNNFSTPQTLSP